MKLFNCEVNRATFEVIDLPRNNWRYVGPRKWQIVLTAAIIITVAIAWAVLS